MELYATMLSRAAAADLALVKSRELVYASGTDLAGRPAIVFVGARIHAACVAGGAELAAARQQVALLLLHETEDYTHAPFVLVFLATDMPRDAGPTFDFLRSLLSAMPKALHKQLHRFYLVHPSLKMRFTFFVLGALLWGKIEYVDRLEQLRKSFPLGTLLVPDFVGRRDDAKLREDEGYFDERSWPNGSPSGGAV